METLKKRIIRGLADISDTEAAGKKQLILTTAIGLISGKIYTGEEARSEPIGKGSIGEFLPGIVGNYNPAEIDENDGFLALKDVTIRIGANNMIFLDSLVVFYDQIIGVTIGSID